MIEFVYMCEGVFYCIKWTFHLQIKDMQRLNAEVDFQRDENFAQIVKTLSRDVISWAYSLYTYVFVVTLVIG